MLRYFSSKAMYHREWQKHPKWMLAYQFPTLSLTFFLVWVPPKAGPETRSRSHRKGIHLEESPKSMSEWEERVRQGQRKSQYEGVLKRSQSTGSVCQWYLQEAKRMPSRKFIWKAGGWGFCVRLSGDINPHTCRLHICPAAKLTSMVWEDTEIESKKKLPGGWSGTPLVWLWAPMELPQSTHYGSSWNQRWASTASATQSCSQSVVWILCSSATLHSQLFLSFSPSMSNLLCVSEISYILCFNKRTGFWTSLTLKFFHNATYHFKYLFN